MPFDPSPEHEWVREALAPGADCPPLESLERLLDPQAAPPDLARHVETCAHCRAELELLRAFHTDTRDEAEADAVRQIAGRLRSRAGEITGIAPTPLTEPWWRRLFQVRWLSPAAVAMAGLLLAAALGVEWWRGAPPRLHAPDGSSAEVLRSGSFDVVSPAGDIKEIPEEVTWRPAMGAVRYQVRLLGVDGRELWAANFESPRAGIPAEVRAKIIPSKTLLVQVTALDGSGRKIAESEPVRFRVLHNVYKR